MASRRLSDEEREAIQKRVDRKFHLFKSTPSAQRAEGAGAVMATKDSFILNSMASLRMLAQKIAKGEVNTSTMMLFNENGDVLDNDSVTRLLMQMAGDGTRTVPTPGNNGASFPASASIVDRPANDAAPAPLKTPYLYADEDGGFKPWVKVGPNFIAGTADPGIAPASAARFPDAGTRPQVDAGQPFADVRQADPFFTVTKRAASKVRKGTFAGVLDQFKANDGTGA